jgi:hypothetical protein
MEYGSIIWDPYTHQEITKLESIQGEARFIAKDYKSREEGCMTKMLNELNLPTLLSSRQKQRLIFFYKVVEGQVPAMPSGGSLYILLLFLTEEVTILILTQLSIYFAPI